MRVLFTGASSFTGFWFVRELAAAGHEVVTTFTRADEAAYTDGSIRGNRVELLRGNCEPQYGVRFGDDRFLELLKNSSFDVLCHHGADVTDYRSPDYDVTAAVKNNTHRTTDVLAAMKESGCGRLVITGSVFEGGEGAGSDGLPHFSPYGLAKSLSAEVFKYYCGRDGIALSKFVIPNPFGPYEEPRFTRYLMKTWFAGETATVRTPDYVRDNVHVSLLARCYASFVGRTNAEYDQVGPSGYVESQGTFAQRVAAEMRPRLGLACQVAAIDQAEFSEPHVRCNTLPLGPLFGHAEEATAWDAVARFYEDQFVARDAAQ